MMSRSFSYMRDVVRDKIQDLEQARKVAESARTESELLQNYLNNIVNSMPSLLVGVDADAKVTQWNREAELSTGINVNDAVGQLLEKVLPRLLNQMSDVHEAIREREVRSEPRVLTSKGHESIYEDVTIFPLVEGGMKGAVIRIDNVTERVHLENMMVQSEKMMSVGGLAAGMAHEINNPLAAITQGIQNILRRLDPGKEKNIEVAQKHGVDLYKLQAFLEERKINAFLSGGRVACERAAAIVKNMLMFSRKSDSKLAPHNIVQVVERTIELGGTDYDMRKKYDFKFIDIIKEFDAELPAVVCCASEIEQVLLNLLKNAVQAMESVDREEFKPQFHIRLINEKNYVRVEVEDNGPGIPDSIKSRIFEPFFTTKAVGVGTGLGLSVSYMIITQNHGGTFEVESDADRGTKFIIRLPFDGRPH